MSILLSKIQTCKYNKLFPKKGMSVYRKRAKLALDSFSVAPSRIELLSKV